MSYQGISIREVLDKINANTNGWYLPEVQRQYVWGNRNNSEDYVCLLLDSLLQGYPIGGIVVWENSAKVPFRLFLTDYASNKFNKSVEEGRWGQSKSLVYDGQQRLQTLYSVLKYTFNDRVLHYDLFFDAKNANADETGFLFRNKDAAPELRYLKLTELCSISCSEESEAKYTIEDRLVPLYENDKEKRSIVRQNLNRLWDIFVKDNEKQIAYFPIKASSPDTANEVFRRLNIGGVSLTSVELVLSKIKAKYYDFEEKLWELSNKIKKYDIEFSSEQLLQLLYLLIKGTIRVDDRYFKGTDEELDLFNSKLEEVEIPLLDFFNYLRSEFNINHNYIIPRWAAILPMIIYLIRRNEINHNYKWSDNYNDEHKKQMKAVHQYFLSSQILDWNTQTMVNEFSRLATESAINQREFPLSEIKAFAVSKNRVGELNENNFTWQPWFALKMLQPGRAFNFTENKPHIDHIFPMNRGIDDEMYQNEVDVLWNFQILPAGVNLYKWNKSPKEFLLAHPELKEKFDFLPNLENEVWNNHIDFIQYRKNLMIKYLKERYDISLNS